MKKLAVLFIVLVSVISLIGCGSKKTVVNPSAQSTNGTKTTITELKSGDKTVTTSDSTSAVKDPNDVEFAIISLINDTLNTDKSYQVIDGVTPKTTAKITVNNQTLTKYKAGETKWSYIAATSLGTLKKGLNNYTINAFDKNGTTIASKKFTINYTGTSSSASSTGNSTSSLASTGSNSWMISIIVSLAVGVFYLRRRMA